MAYETKTRIGTADIEPFLDAVTPPVRQADARRLITIFREETGFEPHMWATMVGFGSYAYTYDTGHSGTALATGFAPRKAELVLYIGSGVDTMGPILDRLGKHRQSKACIYVRKLTDIDEGALRDLIRAGLADLAKRWPITPT
jgi:hypothetical protein